LAQAVAFCCTSHAFAEYGLPRQHLQFSLPVMGPVTRHLSCRRPAAVLLLPLLGTMLLFKALAFVSAPRRTRLATAHPKAPLRAKMLSEEEKNLLEEAMYPPEKMFQSNEDGTIMREVYPGARDFTSIFWAIIQPGASLGFLIVGISAFFGEPIVNWNPVTKSLLPFLTNLDGINWVPQGIFMSFYGFFGFFLFGPLQWYLVYTNKGNGIAEFNKKTRRFTIIRDNELLQDLDFDEISYIKFEWTNLAALGNREIFFVKKNGDEVHFMDSWVEELPKRILERRASMLAEFLDKDLEVDDS